MSIHEMEEDLFPAGIFKLLIMKIEHFTKYICHIVRR